MAVGIGGSGGFGPLANTGLQSSVGADAFGGGSPEEYRQKRQEDLRQKQAESQGRIRKAQELSQYRIHQAENKMRAAVNELNNLAAPYAQQLENVQAAFSLALQQEELVAGRARAGQGRAAAVQAAQSRLAWYGGQAKGGRIPPPPGARAPIEGTVVSRR